MEERGSRSRDTMFSVRGKVNSILKGARQLLATLKVGKNQCLNLQLFHFGLSKSQKVTQSNLRNSENLPFFNHNEYEQ